jgi:hypothetical protein
LKSLDPEKQKKAISFSPAFIGLRLFEARPAEMGVEMK